MLGKIVDDLHLAGIDDVITTGGIGSNGANLRGGDSLALVEAFADFVVLYIMHKPSRVKPFLCPRKKSAARIMRIAPTPGG